MSFLHLLTLHIRGLWYTGSEVRYLERRLDIFNADSGLFHFENTVVSKLCLGTVRLGQRTNVVCFDGIHFFLLHREQQVSGMGRTNKGQGIDITEALL